MTAGWASTYPSSTGRAINYLYEYPKATDIVPKQAAYLRAYVDSVERALAAPTFASPTTLRRSERRPQAWTPERPLDGKHRPVCSCSFPLKEAVLEICNRCGAYQRRSCSSCARSRRLAGGEACYNGLEGNRLVGGAEPLGVYLHRRRAGVSRSTS